MNVPVTGTNVPVTGTNVSVTGTNVPVTGTNVPVGKTSAQGRQMVVCRSRMVLRTGGPDTFADVGALERDARRRLQRVALVFEALFALTAMGLVILDLIPPKPHLECHVAQTQTMSHYPHPYGEPPPSEWTVCAWR